MKNLKNIGRRSISLFLVFVLCISMLNLTVFADTDVKLPKVEIASQNEAGVTKTGADGASITGKKTIAPVEGSDNQFDITLEVTTKSKAAVVASSDAAVVLVIDVSGSMDDKVGNTKKITSAKDSAKNFISNLKANTVQNSDGTWPKRYVSLVEFSYGASVALDWVNIMADNGDTTVKNAIDNLSADGGTNLEQGLSKANDQMGSFAINNVSNGNKYTVVLTDGEPTYYGWEKYEGFILSWWQPEGGNGEDSSQTICDKTVATADVLKGNSNTIYTVFYGDAQKKCYGSVKIIDFLKRISDDPKSAADASELDETFKNISTTIANAVNASGTIVTDHMSDYVTYMRVIEGKGGNYSEGDKTLSWNLSQAEPTTITEGGFTVSTYTLTYRVTVNRTDEFYAAVKKDGEVPTNGDTTLPYTLGNESGTLNFDVPTVKSDLPTVLWHIEYYKQTGVDEESGEKIYKLANESNKFEGTFGDTVTLASKDTDYADKYTRENYTCVKADTSIDLSATRENVIKVYYDRDTTSATVNYHYTLTTIAEDGTSSTETVDVPGNSVTGLYVGEEYAPTVSDKSEYDGVTYDFEKAEPTSKKIAKLDKDESKNVINLHYVATVDNRVESNIVVNHVYRIHTWTLENGKYVLKDTESDPIQAGEYTGKIGLSETISTNPIEGYEEFAFNEADSKLTNPVPYLQNGTKTVTLYFDATVDDRGPELSMTVRHHYTKSVTTIEDGKVVTTVKPRDEVVTETIKFYAGATVTISENTVYGEDTYPSNPANASLTGAKKTTAADNGTTIDLHYTITEAPEKTTVTVKHIYQSVTHETVTTYEDVETEVFVGNKTEIDEDGNETEMPVYETVIEQVETGKTVEEKIDTDDTDEVTDDNVYAGQSYTAIPVGKPDYECQTSEAKRTATVAEDGSTVIEVYYLKDNGATDKRDDASIDVMHVYTTHLTTIAGGVKRVINVTTVEAEPTVTKKAGDTHKAEPKTTDKDGNEYKVVGEPTLTKVLHAGTNSPIVINYERSDSDLKETSYTVSYEYYTRSMTMEDGKIGWSEPALDSTMTKDPYGDDGYVGQKVTLDTGIVDGYMPYGKNPSSIQFLKEEGNDYTFKYVKDEPLPQYTLTVRHHITTRTITLDSDSSFTQDVELPAVSLYEGQTYTAETLPVGTLKLVKLNGSVVALDELVDGILSGTIVDRNVVVDFDYEIVNDYRTPATYTVQHIYRTINWDGSVKEDVNEPWATKTFVFMTGSASISLPENAGYKLISSTFNGEAVKVDENGTYSFTVRNGENAVVFVYERQVDNRTITSAKVIHEYYANEAAMETGAEATREEIATDRRATAQFTAEPITENGGRAYEVYGNPTLTITLSEKAEENVITIRYIRAETTYQVIHEYYTDGEFDGSTSSTVGGQAGATITADSITKVTTYGGNDYSYTSASGDLVLVQGANGEITLRYDRTTTGGGGGPSTPIRPSDNDDDDDDDYTPPAEVIEPEDVPLVDTPVEEPAEEEEIISEDVPLVETPVEEPAEEEEIIPEDVPLSEVPKTSDLSSLWYTMALLSACGLAAMALLKKREK